LNPPAEKRTYRLVQRHTRHSEDSVPEQKFQ
jgi:hypothetical protein